MESTELETQRRIHDHDFETWIRSLSVSANQWIQTLNPVTNHDLVRVYLGMYQNDPQRLRILPSLLAWILAEQAQVDRSFENGMGTGTKTVSPERIVAHFHLLTRNGRKDNHPTAPSTSKQSVQECVREIEAELEPQTCSPFANVVPFDIRILMVETLKQRGILKENEE